MLYHCWKLVPTALARAQDETEQVCQKLEGAI
jgi:hypothetical protein